MVVDRFDARQKRWLALGLLVFIIIALISGFIVPLVTYYYENKMAIEKLEFRLGRYTTKIDSRNDIIQQATTMKNAIKSSAVFSSQNSIPLASADMQQHIKNAVASSGGELTSTQNNPQKQLDDLIKISMNVKFSGRIESLKNILFELESARPFMIIEKIKILGITGQRNMTTGKIEPVDKVHISADVASFIPVIDK